MSELHNPDNLTPEQYGASEGYRLLNKDEVHFLGNNKRCVEMLSTDGTWNPGFGGVGHYTYRTRLTPAELRKARGLEPLGPTPPEGYEIVTDRTLPVQAGWIGIADGIFYGPYCVGCNPIQKPGCIYARPIAKPALTPQQEANLRASEAYKALSEGKEVEFTTHHFDTWFPLSSYVYGFQYRIKPAAPIAEPVAAEPCVFYRGMRKEASA